MLAGAGLFMLAMITAAWMLLRDMRGQERYGARIRQIHGEQRVTAVNTERVALRQIDGPRDIRHRSDHPVLRPCSGGDQGTA